MSISVMTGCGEFKSTERFAVYLEYPLENCLLIQYEHFVIHPDCLQLCVSSFMKFSHKLLLPMKFDQLHFSEMCAVQWL